MCFDKNTPFYTSVAGIELSWLHVGIRSAKNIRVYLGDIMVFEKYFSVENFVSIFTVVSVRVESGVTIVASQ